MRWADRRKVDVDDGVDLALADADVLEDSVGHVPLDVDEAIRRARASAEWKGA